AKTMASFNQMVSDASVVATDKERAAFDAIAHSSMSAADKVAILRAYIASLPNSKKIDIALLFHGNMGLANALGLGNPGGGGTGHQQGDEWNFTLEGEDYATRAAYMNMYHDYGTANAAWERDHRAELEQKGVTGPGQH